MAKAKGVHLVGSVPLASAEAVFTHICGAFGPHLRRVPDGETGMRKNWIGFQHEMLAAHPAVMLDPAGRTVPIRDIEGGISRENHLFVLNPDMGSAVIHFRPLGYAEAALESYALLRKLRSSGQIPAHVRFQVCLPTPFATGLLYFHPESQEEYIELMRAALLGELADICAAIPHEELAIQWDCCLEVLLLEGYFPEDWAYDRRNLKPVLGQLGDAVPAAVELGYHLCYGSPVDAPLLKQFDMAVVVALSNGIVGALNRTMDFLHLPVSDPAADGAYFAPLQALEIPAETELYLGLLQPKDPQNDARRIEAARRYRPEFGVATECGWGRKAPERLPELLELHLQAVNGQVD